MRTSRPIRRVAVSGSLPPILRRIALVIHFAGMAAVADPRERDV